MIWQTRRKPPRKICMLTVHSDDDFSSRMCVNIGDHNASPGPLQCSRILFGAVHCVVFCSRMNVCTVCVRTPCAHTTCECTEHRHPPLLCHCTTFSPLYTANRLVCGESSAAATIACTRVCVNVGARGCVCV